MSDLAENSLFSDKSLVIKQRRELFEAITGFETGNRYEIYNSKGSEVGFIAEKLQGFWSYILKLFLGSHRPFEVLIYDREEKHIMTLIRPFYFFFSRMRVLDVRGQEIGVVQRRFKLLGKKYDFLNSRGKAFAHIQAGLFRIYKFPITTNHGKEAGEILKTWRGMNISGILTELFTDTDNFLVNFGSQSWSIEQKKVILAAAISVDFDYFENNHRD